MVNAHDAPFGEVSIAVSALPRDGHTHKGSKHFKVCNGGGAFAKDVDRGHIATGWLGEAVADSVSSLHGEGMDGRTKVGKFK